MAQFTRRDTLAAAGATLAAMTVPAAAASAPIRIGFGMALSGGLAGGGKAALVAYNIWLDEVNAKGGLLGRKVEFVHYDDQSNPATVPGIYTKLLELDRVDLVLSGYGTVNTAAAMPVIIRKKKLFPSLFALAANDQFNYDRYYQLQPNGPNGKIAFSEGFFRIAEGLNPKPKTVALIGADAEFGVFTLEGARINAKKAGIKIVYDQTYPPSTVDFGSIIRAVQAAKPDLIYMGSYPPDSVGLIRAIHEVGIKAMLVGGGMIGPQYAAMKQQLGPLLNGIIDYDLFEPEKTMKFPGVDAFLAKYREKAQAAGVDPLGFYIPPFAYAELQILAQAITATKSLDDGKLAQYIHANKFSTIVGDISFDKRGEWTKPRVLFIQYQGVVGNDVKQFEKPGVQVILDPPEYKSGNVVAPFDGAAK